MQKIEYDKDLHEIEKIQQEKLKKEDVIRQNYYEKLRKDRFFRKYFVEEILDNLIKNNTDTTILLKGKVDIGRDDEVLALIRAGVMTANNIRIIKEQVGL